MPSENPFMARLANQGKNAHGRSSEKRVAKTLGAQLTPASGALKGNKGDMRKKAKQNMLIEAKSTNGKTLAVDHGWLGKISVEAQNKSAVPALSMRFVDNEGRVKQYGDWVAIPMWLFQELTDELP